MIDITALKYYSHGKFSNPASAQAVIDGLAKKHPDREYTILINMRGSYRSYKRYTAVQVQKVSVKWPEEHDLDLPTLPARVPVHWQYSNSRWERQQYEDYIFELSRRNRVWAAAVAPLKAVLHGKMNP